MLIFSRVYSGQYPMAAVVSSISPAAASIMVGVVVRFSSRASSMSVVPRMALRVRSSVDSFFGIGLVPFVFLCCVT